MLSLHFRPRDERGIALLTAVIFVLLGAIITGGFIATTVHETASTSNVHIAKGALYSADAGVRTMQQELANRARVKLDSLITIHQANGSTGPVISAPGTFFQTTPIILTSTNPKFSVSATVAWADSDIADTSQVFNYRYKISSTGELGVRGSRAVETTGILRVSAGRGSFADYLMFTDIHTSASGNSVWFTSNTRFDGRVHTNGQFKFAYQPQFQDLVTQANSRAWFFDNGSPDELAASSNPPTDVPDFFGGFTRGVAPVTLPTNTFEQQNAALGLSGTSAVSNATINGQLGLGGSGVPPPGIYLPVAGSVVTGGIYVQGNLDHCLVSVNGSGNQVYAMKQGGTTVTVTVDRTANTTTVVRGSNPPEILVGVPRGSMYTTGSIARFAGPTRLDNQPPVPGIANGTQMLFTAAGDIVIQGDIMTTDFDHGNSVVGIYSSGGKVRVGTDAPDNLHIDAFLMALGAQGVVTVDGYDSGAPRGDIMLRGGMVSRYYGAFGQFGDNSARLHGYGRLFSYDRRGLIPPFYPMTPLFNANVPSAQTLAWKEL